MHTAPVFRTTLALVLALCAALLAGPPGRATAQRTEATAAEREARALFEAGEAAYSEGRFQRAYEHFREAHRSSGRAALLYNMGLAAERARLDPEALEAYEQFVAQVPDHPQRALAESRIAALREVIERSRSMQVQAVPSTSSPAPEREPEAAPDPGSDPSDGDDTALIAGIALAAGGVVGLGIGWGLWSELQMSYDRYDALPPTSVGSRDFAELQGRIVSWGPGVAVSSLAGAALLTAALPLVMPQEDGVPWWSLVIGGAGLVVAGLGIWQMTEASYEIGPVANVHAEPVWTGTLLLATSLPLISVPVVYLLRDLTGGTVSSASVRIDATRAELVVGGTL